MSLRNVTERLERVTLEGDNLRGLTTGPQPETRARFRKSYLAWHDELLRVLHDEFPDTEVGGAFETTRWQLVLGGRVTDDELVRTILGDVEAKLISLRRLTLSLAAPPRAHVEPSTVGVAVYDATCLFSKHARHFLLGLAVHGVVRARWSRRLLEETAAGLAGKLRGDSLEDLGRWLKSDAGMVRDGLVGGYEHWLDGITATEPDEFALACIDANPVLATRIVSDHPNPDLFLDRRAASLSRSAERLRLLAD